jgi:hypothetical protein
MTERQKIEMGKEYVTRDGRKARVLCVDRKEQHPVLALIDSDGRESAACYRADGFYYTNGTPSDLDLLPAPKRYEGWVNVYHGGSCSGKMYDTKHEADLAARGTRIACIHISFTEGEGLKP